MSKKKDVQYEIENTEVNTEVENTEVATATEVTDTNNVQEQQPQVQDRAISSSDFEISTGQASLFNFVSSLSLDLQEKLISINFSLRSEQSLFAFLSLVKTQRLKTFIRLSTLVKIYELEVSNVEPLVFETNISGHTQPLNGFVQFKILNIEDLPKQEENV